MGGRYNPAHVVSKPDSIQGLFWRVDVYRRETSGTGLRLPFDVIWITDQGKLEQSDFWKYRILRDRLVAFPSFAAVLFLVSLVPNKSAPCALTCLGKHKLSLLFAIPSALLVVVDNLESECRLCQEIKGGSYFQCSHSVQPLAVYLVDRRGPRMARAEAA